MSVSAIVQINLRAFAAVPDLKMFVALEAYHESAPLPHVFI